MTMDGGIYIRMMMMMLCFCVVPWASPILLAETCFDHFHCLSLDLPLPSLQSSPPMSLWTALDLLLVQPYSEANHPLEVLVRIEELAVVLFWSFHKPFSYRFRCVLSCPMTVTCWILCPSLPIPYPILVICTRACVWMPFAIVTMPVSKEPKW